MVGRWGLSRPPGFGYTAWLWEGSSDLPAFLALTCGSWSRWGERLGLVVGSLGTPVAYLPCSWGPVLGCLCLWGNWSGWDLPALATVDIGGGVLVRGCGEAQTPCVNHEKMDFPPLCMFKLKWESSQCWQGKGERERNIPGLWTCWNYTGWASAGLFF